MMIDASGPLDLDTSTESIPIPEILPVIPMRDLVLFPYTIVPLSVGREASLNAVNSAHTGDGLLLLLTQKDGSLENPGPDDLYDVGCVGQVMRMVKLPDGNLNALVQGLGRVKVDYFSRSEPFLEARVSPLSEPDLDPLSPRLEATVRSIREGLEKVAALGRQVSPEVLLIAAGLEDPLRLADLISANLGLRTADAQAVLEAVDGRQRLELIHRLIEKETALLEMQHEISSQVRGELDRNQREFFLRQQLRTIQKELGEIDDLEQEIEDLRKKADEAKIPETPRKEIDKQLRRLSGMHPDSAESSVVRTCWTGLSVCRGPN